MICANCHRHELIARQAGVDFSPNLETFLLGVIDASLFLESVPSQCCRCL